MGRGARESPLDPFRCAAERLKRLGLASTSRSASQAPPALLQYPPRITKIGAAGGSRAMQEGRASPLNPSVA